MRLSHSFKLLVLYSVLTGLIIGTSAIPAYSQWTWRNPLPQGNTLNVIKVYHDTVVWAAGDVGTLMHSTDGGINWDIRNLIWGSKSRTNYVGLDFVNDSIGYLVNAYGYVYKTMDMGLTWVQKYHETEEFLEGSCFTDALHGYVACNGGKILRTSDGGESWEPYYSAYPYDLHYIVFPSQETGFAMGKGGCILKTNDGGDNWAIIHTDTNAFLNCIIFLDTLTGFVVGDNGYLLKTTDGGITWVPHFLGDTLQFSSIAAFNHDTLIIDGYTDYQTWYSKIIKMRSMDGGNSWTFSQILEDFPYTETMVTVPGGGIYSAGSWGALAQSTDYGETWTSLITSIGMGVIRGIDFPTTQTGYAVTGFYEGNSANGKVLKTIDGGATWSALETNLLFEFLDGICFIDENRGLVGGTKIYGTEDGGETWTLRIDPGWYDITSIACNGSGTCIAVGEAGVFLRSANNGQTWTYVTGVPVVDYSSVSFSDDTTCFATGNHTLLKSANGGISWELISTDYSLNDLEFPNPEMGIGVGYNGFMIRTDDGGATWEIIDSPTEYSLWDIDFYDADTAYIAGASGDANLLKTTDGGTTWKVQFIPSNTGLISVATTGNCAYTGGWGCYLFGTSNGGTLVSAGPTAKKPEISALVYPNPVENSATIRYTLKEPSNVRICIFDSRGTQVREIPEGFKSPGAHEIEIQGESLSPGVYFYRIQAGSEITTKKMIILR